MLITGYSATLSQQAEAKTGIWPDLSSLFKILSSALLLPFKCKPDFSCCQTSQSKKFWKTLFNVMKLAHCKTRVPWNWNLSMRVLFIRRHLRVSLELFQSMLKLLIKLEICLPVGPATILLNSKGSVFCYRDTSHSYSFLLYLQ